MRTSSSATASLPGSIAFIAKSKIAKAPTKSPLSTMTIIECYCACAVPSMASVWSSYTRIGRAFPMSA